MMSYRIIFEKLKPFFLYLKIAQFTFTFRYVRKYLISATLDYRWSAGKFESSMALHASLVAVKIFTSLIDYESVGDFRQ